MGPAQIVLDHNLTYELWRDPLFRELTPWFDDFSEQVNKVTNEAEAQDSSLAIKNSLVYNQWLVKLNALIVSDIEQLRPLFEHIRRKRNNRRESILIPSDKPRKPGIVYEGMP